MFFHWVLFLDLIRFGTTLLKMLCQIFGRFDHNNFDLTFNRYFDGGREGYKLSFKPLLEKFRQLLVAVK